jgi:hypothetical protein
MIIMVGENKRKEEKKKGNIKVHTASSSERTCSMGESVPHSVIIPPKGPCTSPASFSLLAILRNLNFDNCSMSSFVAPSCFDKGEQEKGGEEGMGPRKNISMN